MNILGVPAFDKLSSRYRLGTRYFKSVRLNVWRFCRSLASNALMGIGTACWLCLNFCAVTVISSSATGDSAVLVSAPAGIAARPASAKASAAARLGLVKFPKDGRWMANLLNFMERFLLRRT